MGRKIPAVHRLRTKVRVEGDCLIWCGSTGKDGYGVISIGRSKQFRVHRLAWELAHGPIPEGRLVCHKCDTPRCINVNHLFLGTPKENTGDMIRKGRKHALAGERHPNAKLTDAQVNELRHMRLMGVPLNEVAKQFGVSFQWVSKLTLEGRHASR